MGKFCFVQESQQIFRRWRLRNIKMIMIEKYNEGAVEWLTSSLEVV